MPRKGKSKSRSRKSRKVVRKGPVIRRIKGRGRYEDEGNSLARLGALLGGAAGTAFGGPFGGAVGGLGGAALGKAISKISGLGKYNVAHNTVVHPKQGDQIPAFGHLGDGVRIRKREYLGDIYSSTGFVNNVFPIDISNSTTFPWASQLSTLFQQFKVLGMVFEYRSMSSNALNSTDTALGTVIGTCNYNVNELPYSSKIQMENTIFAESVKPANSCMFPIECDFSQTPSLPLYTKVSPAYQNPTAVNDLRLNQLGNFQIATVGMQQSNVNIGELWLTYDIVFYKEQLDDGAGSSAYSAHIAYNPSDYGFDVPFINPVSAVPLTSADLLQVPGLSIVDAGYSLQIPAGNAGQYMINIVWYSTDTSKAGTLVMPNATYTNLHLLTSPRIPSSPNTYFGGNNNPSISLDQSGSVMQFIAPVQIIDASLPSKITFDMSGVFPLTGVAHGNYIDITLTQFNAGNPSS